jgi:O-methyltransferase
VVKALAHRLLRSFGLDVVRYVPPAPPWPPNTYDAEEWAIMERVRPFTMTSDERISAMVRAARYVVGAGIPGDLVECGVWRGGSMMAAALTLIGLGVRDRALHLFDTFEGMTEPTEADVDYEGAAAAPRFLSQRTGPNASAWCYASLEDATANLASTGYPADRIRFVKGRVEDTLPGEAPERIAILRLDTDWYESTLHELRHLYPRLAVGGVLLVDDYGHWEGCRKATDEYLATLASPPMLCRLDYAAAIAVKR